MEFLLKRRWPRFECKKSVNAKIFWAHRLMPFVSVKLMDVSKKGFGFTSERKLQEGCCELRIRSFPAMMGNIVYRKEFKNQAGDTSYQYGFYLTTQLHKTQIENLGCRGVINIEHINNDPKKEPLG
ncbi:hypothetical protein ERW51_15790 [Aliivibrio finisterrensis]|uniref:hypothetical protein n=1 Tax=Aliivibrio finisterrensis TaxID=511998 RepID=UPI00102189CC|nr:hypothetical protein [Aliivibrio finisterrensis]RYU65396.1 hypothetical protein ERW54_16500 [Aliivibrio finisterrensis]RYU68881.1 hypothetical protein ERW51_15790 [Aliivibrio finisterrensis]RYU72115.1 hypothetical protein ERW48_16225 [Aliivibrio finisterrensis]